MFTSLLLIGTLYSLKDTLSITFCPFRQLFGLTY
nr:MAG TPA: hypothetical protein [Caudoviricetes sp.]